MRGRVALVLAFASLLAACDWSMVGFGPGHTSFNPLEGGIDVANVGSVTESWSAPFGNNNPYSSRPAVVGEVVYIGHNDGALYTFDANGETNCTGAPKTCQPLWTAPTGALISSSPAVVGGFVYVGSSSTLYVFDAKGETGCSGVPKTCTPLWTATGTGGTGSPVVANGKVYIIMGETLHVFDALGEEGCSGSPKTCEALWTHYGGPNGVPAVGAGTVYITANEPAAVAAFDAAGQTNCSGTPKTCDFLWVGITDCGDADISCGASYPVLAAGKVFLTSATFNSFGEAGGTATAFEADGGDNCVPGAFAERECPFVWVGGDGPMSAPAVAGGAVYVTAGPTTQFGQPVGLQVLDGNGVDNCTTVQGVARCSSLWRVPAQGLGIPAVANGVLYVADSTRLRAYDAAGQANCSGTPKTCNSLRSILASNAGVAAGSVVMAGGAVYVPTLGALRTYEVP